MTTMTQTRTRTTSVTPVRRGEEPTTLASRIRAFVPAPASIADVDYVPRHRAEPA